MEDRFRALCARYDLPTPAFNVMVCGYTVDALFAPQRLIVELDSWDFTRTAARLSTTAAGDADTLAAGYATLRITWERPDDVEAARLIQILNDRA